MMGYDEGMKKFLVMMYTFYDWGLHDVHQLAMCDTYEEAVEYIDNHQAPRIGLNNTYYIFEKLAEVVTK